MKEEEEEVERAPSRKLPIFHPLWEEGGGGGGGGGGGRGGGGMTHKN